MPRLSTMRFKPGSTFKTAGGETLVAAGEVGDYVVNVGWPVSRWPIAECVWIDDSPAECEKLIDKFAADPSRYDGDLGLAFWAYVRQIAAGTQQMNDLERAEVEETRAIHRAALARDAVRGSEAALLRLFIEAPGE